MTALHIINVDPARQYVQIRLEGFFDAEGSSRFAQDWKAAVDSLGRAEGRQITLLDVSDCQVISQSNFPRFKALFFDETRASRRLAVITYSALARIQIKRLLGDRPNTQIFKSRKDAEKWLFTPPAPNEASIS